MSQKDDDALPDKQAEKRATDALRRALASPYKPQSELRKPRKPKVKRIKTNPKKS